MAQHNITGRQGEIFAVEFLKNKGHKILACNYRFEKAEMLSAFQKVKRAMMYFI